MANDKTIFFQRVEALCRDRGMDVSDLEAEAGVGGGTIQGWRKGATPRLKTIIKLADFFGAAQAHLEGTTDDPIDYKNIDTSAFNKPVYENFLKKNKGNVEQANREYMEFERAEAQDALSDRATVFQNNGENYGVMGNTHAPVKIVNGTERVLTEQETELLRLFSELGIIEQAKVLAYVADLKEKGGRA